MSMLEYNTRHCQLETHRTITVFYLCTGCRDKISLSNPFGGEILPHWRGEKGKSR